MTMSDARVKCVPSTMIIGVGCGKSYNISNPTRIFIRNAFRFASPKWLRSRRIQGGTALFGQMRSIRQKAMAICRERAHREQCPKTSNASCDDELVNLRDHAIA